MSAVGSFLFSNLVLPAIAVQAKETDIDKEHHDNHGAATALPTDKLGLGSSGVGHDAAPAYASSRRNLLSLRQSSRNADDDAIFQELMAFRQWQSQQPGFTPRQTTGYSPAHHLDGGIRQRSGGAPNIIVINAGDTSAMRPSNLSSTQDPGQPRDSAVQIFDGAGQPQSSEAPLPVIAEEESKLGKDVKVDMGDGQYADVIKPTSELPGAPSPYGANTTIVQQSPAAAKRTLAEHKAIARGEMYTQEELYQAATQFYHRLLAEALGTWAVTFFIAGLVIESSLGHIPQMGVAIGAGLVFVTLIYSLGQVSGAHFNPVVTYAFVLRGMFPLLWLPFYWIVQFVGAIIAAAMLLGFYGSTIGDAGATLVPAAYSEKAGFLMETVLVMVLVFTILSMASRSKIVGPHAALAIGAVIAFNIMLAGSYSGASMNPWRSVCVSIVFPVSFYSIWVYFAGPFLGATIAVLFIFLLAGRPREEELSAGIGATIAVAVGNAISRDEDEEEAK